jgi:hypothetical protein
MSKKKRNRIETRRNILWEEVGYKKSSLARIFFPTMRKGGYMPVSDHRFSLCHL